MSRWPLALLFPLVCSGRAEEPCVIAAGEVASVRDPRWRDPNCIIEVGAQLRLYVEEVDPPRPTVVRLDVHPACESPRALDAEVARVRAYLIGQGIPAEGISEAVAACATPARIDAVIIETK